MHPRGVCATPTAVQPAPAVAAQRAACCYARRGRAPMRFRLHASTNPRYLGSGEDPDL